MLVLKSNICMLFNFEARLDTRRVSLNRHAPQETSLQEYDIFWSPYRFKISGGLKKSDKVNSNWKI
jgi:hypothetical protein